MKKYLYAALFTATFLFLFACKSKDSAPATSTGDLLKYETRSFVKRQCANDDQCADYNIIYPVISGNDAALADAVSKAVQQRIIAGLGGNERLPFEVALDSAGLQFIEQFVQTKRDDPAYPMGHTVQMTGNVPLNTSKVLTVRLDFASYAGGAHPNSASAVVSFDLANRGRQLTAVDLLKDTSAVLPLLEKAYKHSKDLKDGDDIGQLLFPDIPKLPLPVNIGVVPEGIMFAYNDYEVAPHAVGPADILLTWEQLGDLADKSKYMDK